MFPENLSYVWIEIKVHCTIDVPDYLFPTKTNKQTKQQNKARVSLHYQVTYFS